MKICDVEFQGDGRKCTFYYTADSRIDFRELIRQYAKEFQVKIEMRQIGARQESARIGGLGNCGRESGCSTWLTEFKSVNTAAARYQNLAINQTKLSGMCGRLKCCLNYELDTYIDALEDFPDRAEKLKTNAGLAILVKTDVFKRLMFLHLRHRPQQVLLHPCGSNLGSPRHDQGRENTQQPRRHPRDGSTGRKRRAGRSSTRFRECERRDTTADGAAQKEEEKEQGRQSRPFPIRCRCAGKCTTARV